MVVGHRPCDAPPCGPSARVVNLTKPKVTPTPRFLFCLPLQIQRVLPQVQDRWHATRPALHQLDCWTARQMLRVLPRPRTDAPERRARLLLPHHPHPQRARARAHTHTHVRATHLFWWWCVCVCVWGGVKFCSVADSVCVCACVCVCVCAPATAAAAMPTGQARTTKGCSRSRLRPCRRRVGRRGKSTWTGGTSTTRATASAGSTRSVEPS